MDWGLGPIPKINYSPLISDANNIQINTHNFINEKMKYEEKKIPTGDIEKIDIFIRMLKIKKIKIYIMKIKIIIIKKKKKKKKKKKRKNKIILKIEEKKWKI